MKSNKEKGVTLIALAITVIVILILAGISIGTLKNDGTLDKTQSSAKIETAAEEENVLRLAYTQMEMSEGIANSNLTLESFKTYMSKHTKEYYIDENVLETEKTKAIATTENATKFVKVIFENTGNSYIIGLSEETEKPTYDYYVITYDANSGTNAPEKQYNRVGYPTNITSQEPIKTGFNFLGWAETSTAKEAKYTAGNSYIYGIDVTLYAVWKDATPPIIDLVTSTSSSITIQAHDDESGISGYAISTTNSVPTKFTGVSNQKSITQTISSLTQTTTYYVWVKNGEGLISEVKSTKTPTIPGVTLSADKSGWTNGNVIVTAKANASGYTLQTSTNNKNWGTTNPITFSQNGTMYARLVDSSGQVGKNGSYNVTNIDKTKPSVNISASGINNKVVTLTAKGSDSQSGIKQYQFYVGGQLKHTINTSSTSGQYNYTTTFDNSLSAYVITTDVAGNTIQSNSVTFVDYTIKTLDELKRFRDKVNSGTTYNGITITQIADINLNSSSWTPISGSGFRGTYNGQNHTISNLYINSTSENVGLFGINYGKINNLNLTSGSVRGMKNVGMLVGTNGGTITNVNINGGSVVGAYDYGGVCGLTSGNITSCNNSANITCDENLKYTTIYGWSAGGICGYMSSNATISKCGNTGSVTGTHDAGGIIGTVNHGSIDNCYNKATITANYEPTKNYSHAGGIAGMAAWSGQALITNCYNTGAINTQISTGNGGGICGGGLGKTENNQTITITNCYNIGTVSAKFNRGGIIGEENVKGTANLSNNYWLKGTASVGRGKKSNNNGASIVKKADDMKGLTGTLGSAYKADSSNKNGGYPILSWQ